jgi:hypothetical protein
MLDGAYKAACPTAILKPSSNIPVNSLRILLGLSTMNTQPIYHSTQSFSRLEPIDRFPGKLRSKLTVPVDGVHVSAKYPLTHFIEVSVESVLRQRCPYPECGGGTKPWPGRPSDFARHIDSHNMKEYVSQTRVVTKHFIELYAAAGNVRSVPIQLRSQAIVRRISGICSKPTSFSTGGSHLIELSSTHERTQVCNDCGDAWTDPSRRTRHKCPNRLPPEMPLTPPATPKKAFPMLRTPSGRRLDTKEIEIISSMTNSPC